MKVKEERGKAALKLSIQNSKIMPSSLFTSWQIDGGTAGVQPQLIQGIRRRDGIGEGQETTA